jgi:hypothetical protein
MSRARVAILFYILAVAALSVAAQALAAESPKASKAAKSPEAATKAAPAMVPKAAAAPVSGNAGPATEGEVSIPPKPSSTSAADTQGLADADHSGATSLVAGATIAGAAVVANILFY